MRNVWKKYVTLILFKFVWQGPVPWTFRTLSDVVISVFMSRLSHGWTKYTCIVKIGIWGLEKKCVNIVLQINAIIVLLENRHYLDGPKIRFHSLSLTFLAGDPGMHQRKQIPCISSMLTRDVFFPPKTRRNWGALDTSARELRRLVFPGVVVWDCRWRHLRGEGWARMASVQRMAAKERSCQNGETCCQFARNCVTFRRAVGCYDVISGGGIVSYLASDVE